MLSASNEWFEEVGAKFFHDALEIRKHHWDKGRLYAEKLIYYLNIFFIIQVTECYVFF